jgi:hypothetical protein
LKKELSVPNIQQGARAKSVIVTVGLFIIRVRPVGQCVIGIELQTGSTRTYPHARKNLGNPIGLLCATWRKANVVRVGFACTYGRIKAPIRSERIGTKNERDGDRA